MIKFIRRFLFGEDIFVSYSRADGYIYAAGLASELAKRNLVCRFDQWGARPGREIPADLLSALKRSAMLVVVATPETFQSKAVEEEINAFLPTNRLIAPIEVACDITKARWWPLLEGLAISREKVIQESAHPDGVPSRPSQDVIDRIENSINFTRRNQRVSAIFAVTATTVVVLAVLGIVARRSAQTAREDADRQRALSEIARAATATANTQLEQAKGAVGLARQQLTTEQGKVTAATNAQRILNADLTKARQDYAQQVQEYNRQIALTAAADVKRQEAEDQARVAQQSARQQTDIAESRRLARLSRNVVNNDTQATRLALQALEKAETDEAREAALVALPLLMRGSSDAPSQMKVDRSGRWGAVSSPNGDAVIADFVSNKTFHLCGYPKPLAGMAFSPSGRFLATSRQVGEWDEQVLEIWDTAQGRRLASADVFSRNFQFSPDESLLFARGYPALLVDVPSGRIRHRLEPADSAVFDKDSGTIVTWDSTKADVWRLSDGAKLASLPEKYFVGFRYLENGTELVPVWRISTTLKPPLRAHEYASTPSSGTRFEYRTGRLPIDRNRISALTPLRDESSFDAKLLVGMPVNNEYSTSWNDPPIGFGWPVFESVATIISPRFALQFPKSCVASMDQLARFAVCHYGRTAPVLYNVATGEAGVLNDWRPGNPTPYQTPLNGLSNTFFSPDGILLATQTSDGHLSMWNVATRTRIWDDAQTPLFRGFMFADDSTRFIGWRGYPRSGRLIVRNSRTGATVSVLDHGNTEPDSIELLSINRDGTRAITRTADILRLWDVDRGSVLTAVDIVAPDRMYAEADLKRVSNPDVSAAELAEISRRRLRACPAQPTFPQ